MSADDGLAAAQANWEPIPPERRRAWCQTLLSYPPIWFGVFPMLETQRLVLAGGYANSETWVDVAKRAEAVGFTPRTWLIFRQSLEPAYLKDRFPAHPENMPKRRGNGGVETVVVDPEDFSEWPWLFEAGYRAWEATENALSDASPWSHQS
ncbi:mandelate racemase/muconate lactonizing protein [Rhodococcus fascians]|nr:mandelate racemase/muconate lactonizing protein [Rhodococcus fascians]MBY4397256.1 mandelate racemase/muconate lactonizing protein [Rhodococcus fascians]MBY4406076.1 mandelate racemase/muconate lactonizing protein [Rhodococcus fascians]MBY4422003.1 mandelate racemase/muconate lactonizing protein [Rhodococcus fascians]MBY4461498.1 mandelate racemase/muconate lactonizing protein [Rhodococcus fascians]